MKLRTTVARSTGKTQHTIGAFVAGKPTPIAKLPVPKWLEIADADGGFHLFHLDAEGKCFADTWHASLAEAKEQAAFEFGIAFDDWNEIEQT